MRANLLRDELCKALTGCSKVRGIGQTGNKNEELVPGKSDIDLFVICSEIPNKMERAVLYEKITSVPYTLSMEVCKGGVWGYGDILLVDGIDVMPMYFTVREMTNYLVDILKGEHQNKEGQYYPVGRLASISTIQILYEKNESFHRLVQMVNLKPVSFFRNWYQNEINQVINEEDLSRVELRKEVLFFHQVLESALDHLLQALFAVNNCYFPSRKRTLKIMDTFLQKPENCEKRFLALIENGAKSETMDEAVKDLKKLTQEVKEIGAHVFRVWK